MRSKIVWLTSTSAGIIRKKTASGVSVARSDPHPRLFTVRADEGILEQVRGHDFLCGANYKEKPLCGEKSACDKRMADRQGRGDKGRPVPEKDSRMLFADSVSVVAAVVPENLTTGCAASGVAEFVYPHAITSLAWPREGQPAVIANSTKLAVQ